MFYRVNNSLKLRASYLMASDLFLVSSVELMLLKKLYIYFSLVFFGSFFCYIEHLKNFYIIMFHPVNYSLYTYNKELPFLFSPVYLMLQKMCIIFIVFFL